MTRRVTAWKVDTQFSKPVLIDTNEVDALARFQSEVAGYVREVTLPETETYGGYLSLELGFLVNEDGGLRGLAVNQRARLLYPHTPIYGDLLIVGSGTFKTENGKEWGDVTRVVASEEGAINLLMLYAVHWIQRAAPSGVFRSI